MRRIAAACLTAAVLIAAPAAAAGPPDEAIVRAVVGEIVRSPLYTIFDDVDVAGASGVVTLTGVVTRPEKRTDYEARAARVDGVRRVRNRLSVLPASAADEELRYRIARAIYGSPSFWQHAAMAAPPIHIVVERGRVRLTGVVRNDAERRLARSLAASCDAVSVTNELRTAEEVLVSRRH